MTALRYTDARLQDDGMTTVLTIHVPRELWFTSNSLRGSHHRWDSKIKALRIMGRRWTA